MNRQVIIIKGYSKTDEELGMDRYYAERYSTFFNSKAGGAYEPDEIKYYEDVNAKELSEYLSGLDLNFAVLVLIGHGATQNDNQLFQLNETEIIKAGQLVLDIEKQLIIIESCRSDIQSVYTVDLNDKIPKFKYGGIVRAVISRPQARALYDEQLEKCGSGIVVCFACSNDETAKNYYFSLVLIQIAFNWHLEHWHHFETLNISRLLPLVSSEVNEFSIKITGERQNPVMNVSIDFPFSVSKF